MAEIKTKVEKLEEEKPYTPGQDEYLITENHTISDIIRWLVTDVCNGDKGDIEFLLSEYE